MVLAELGGLQLELRECLEMMVVEGLRGEAEFDSRGAFSLDSTRALIKLAGHSLHRKTDYLLKWVQAGNLMSATRVEFVITDDSVKVSYFGGIIPDLEQLQQGLAPLCRGPGQALLLGQLDASARPGWQVACQRRDKGCQLHLTRPKQPEKVCCSEILELRRRCLFSACRVVVNGHQVEPDYPTVPAKQGDRFLRGDFILGEFRPGSMAAVLPPASHTGTFTVMEAGEELPVWVLLRYLPGSHTRTLLVRDGVLEESSRPTLTEAVADVSDLPSDLSGLRSLEGQELQQRMEAIQGHRRVLEERVLAQVDQIQALYAPAELTGYGRAMARWLIFPLSILVGVAVTINVRSPIQPLFFLISYVPLALGLNCLVSLLSRPHTARAWARHNRALRRQLTARLKQSG
ncbi:hypothetical protein IV102_28900 [bacterium]|nr:hypothetical protein [bacterium]